LASVCILFTISRFSSSSSARFLSCTCSVKSCNHEQPVGAFLSRVTIEQLCIARHSCTAIPSVCLLRAVKTTEPTIKEASVGMASATVAINRKTVTHFLTECTRSARCSAIPAVCEKLQSYSRHRTIHLPTIKQSETFLPHSSENMYNTVQLLRCKTLNFISPELWPHNSPELI